MSHVLTFGLHNLYDEHGDPTAFADVIAWTEAIPRTVRQRLGLQRPPAKDYRTYAPREIPGVALSWKDNIIEIQDKGFRIAHPGSSKTPKTPQRGTVWVDGVHILTRIPFRFIAGHRINNAFFQMDGKPDRGGNPERRRLWAHHQAMDAKLTGVAEAAHRVVVIGEDGNKPEGEVFLGLAETQHGYDRIGWSKDHRIRLQDVETLSREGSDHPRKRATFQISRSS